MYERLFVLSHCSELTLLAALGHDKAQNIIDQITSAYESGGPPPGGFGFGPQHLGAPPPGFGGPPMGYGQPMPPPGFGSGRESRCLVPYKLALKNIFHQPHFLLVQASRR